MTPTDKPKMATPNTNIDIYIPYCIIYERNAITYHIEKYVNCVLL